jgi:purine-nucleoside phosphorylase
MSYRLAKALLSGDPAEREKFLQEETLRHAVMTKIFCQISGQVLDVRDAVLFTCTHNGNTGAVVMKGDRWDAMSEGVLAKAAEIGAAVEVIDGRAL